MGRRAEAALGFIAVVRVQNLLLSKWIRHEESRLKFVVSIDADALAGGVPFAIALDEDKAVGHYRSAQDGSAADGDRLDAGISYADANIIDAPDCGDNLGGDGQL